MNAGYSQEIIVGRFISFSTAIATHIFYGRFYDWMILC